MTSHYEPRVSVLWWTEQRAYTLFMLRELSSVFVAWFTVYLLLLVRAGASGPADYAAFLSWAAAPWVVAINVVALAFVLLHVVTWFALTPQAMVVRLRGRRLPPEIRGYRVPANLIILSQYGGLVVVSAAIALVVP